MRTCTCCATWASWGDRAAISALRRGALACAEAGPSEGQTCALRERVTPGPGRGTGGSSSAAWGVCRPPQGRPRAGGRGATMPAMEAFGRRWHIGSDDLPLPMISLMAVHVVWCAAPPLGHAGVVCTPALAVFLLRPPPPRRWGPQPHTSDAVSPHDLTRHRCLVVLASFVGALGCRRPRPWLQPAGGQSLFSTPPALRHSRLVCNSGASENLHACPHGFTFGVRGHPTPRSRKSLPGCATTL